MCLSIFGGSLVAKAAAQAAGSKIPLSAASVTDAFGIDSLDQPALALFDEQGLAGDPLSGHGGKCNTSWNPGWQE